MIRRARVALVAAAVMTAGTVVATGGATSAGATTVTQAYQCVDTAFGATQVNPPQDLAVTITMPANVTVGSASDVAQVSVAAPSGGSAPRSPQVRLENVSVSLQVGLELVTTTTMTPPSASAPANGVSSGASSTVVLPSVAPSTEWAVPGTVPVALGVAGIKANDIVWPRPATITYSWTADSGTAGSTTCVPVDDTANLGLTTVTNPVAGVYPPKKAPYAGTTTALAAPAVINNVCTSSPCSINEEVEGEVGSGDLTLSQASGNVTFPTVTLNGAAQNVSADLNQLTIIDARGTDAPWTITASMTDFSNVTQTTGANRTIPATALSWVPTCTPTTALPGSVVTGGSGAFVAGAGSVQGNPTTASRVLCDHAADLGGGTWTADAAMTLTVPPTIKTGQYTATMYLTIA